MAAPLSDPFRTIRGVLTVLPGGGHVSHARIADVTDTLSCAKWLVEYGDVVGEMLHKASEGERELRQLRIDLAAVRRVLGTGERS